MKLVESKMHKKLASTTGKWLCSRYDERWWLPTVLISLKANGWRIQNFYFPLNILASRCVWVRRSKSAYIAHSIFYSTSIHFLRENPLLSNTLDRSFYRIIYGETMIFINHLLRCGIFIRSTSQLTLWLREITIVS